MLRWKIETHSHTHMHAHTICTTDWVKNSKYLAFRPKCFCGQKDKWVRENEDADTKANKMLAGSNGYWIDSHRKKRQTVRYTQMTTTATTIENDLFLVNGCVFGVSFRNMSHRCCCCCCCCTQFRRTSSFGWHWTLFFFKFWPNHFVRSFFIHLCLYIIKCCGWFSRRSLRAA